MRSLTELAQNIAYDTKAQGCNCRKKAQELLDTPQAARSDYTYEWMCPVHGHQVEVWLTHSYGEITVHSHPLLKGCM